MPFDSRLNWLKSYISNTAVWEACTQPSQRPIFVPLFYSWSCFQMWDEDIPSFIQALTTLDDGSFISSSTVSPVAKPVQQAPCEIEDQDCHNEAYEGISSPGATSGESVQISLISVLSFLCIRSSCSSLSCIINLADTSTVKGWEEIPVKQWTCTDVVQWLKFTLIPFGVDPERNVAFEHFRNIDGLALSSMTLSDFVTCSSTFGSFLYDKLQTYLRAESSMSNLYQRE